VRVLRVPGVRSVVSAGPERAPIPAREIEAVRAMIRSGLPVKPWPFLKVGQRVVVTAGPLRGVEGILVEFRKTWHVIVSVELLQRSVAAEVDLDSVSPVK
jgi:transcription antitermination factor NusG